MAYITPLSVATHEADTSDAHDASAISVVDSGAYFTGTDVEAALQELGASLGSGGAPTNANYLVGTANGSLSDEIVVGTTPGGELGGTWASPTVDATHSGSAHTDFIAKAFVDAKGDILTASAADTPAILTVGSNDTILMADSGQTTGLKWASPASTSEIADAISGSEAAGTSDTWARGDHVHHVGIPAICQGRLSVVVSPDDDLYFTPYKGNKIIWNNGTSNLTLSGFSCTITSAGLSASTLYYVYVYSNSGTAALEISATGHTTQSNGDTTKTGDTSRLLVGMIYTNGDGDFWNETQHACVINYHNRLPMFAAGVGAVVDVTHAEPTWTEIGDDGNNLIDILSWGYELGVANDVTMGISGQAKTDNAAGRVDYLFGTQALGTGVPVSSVMSTSGALYQNASGSSTMGLTEGHHVVTVWARAYGGFTGQVNVNSFAKTYG